jgi:hypothetical protein
MAPPILLGSLKGSPRSPASVRNFVIENVPCTNGGVPQEWTHAIYAKLRQYGVAPAVIQAGLALARRDGYVFDDGRVPVSTLASVPNLTPTNNTSYSLPSEGPKQTRKRVAEMLEYQFERARANNNYSDMERIAQEFVDVLNKAPPGTIEEEEMQWGAPLLRGVVRMADGSDPGPASGTNGAPGWPYRPLWYVTGDLRAMEGEGEAEGE